MWAYLLDKQGQTLCGISQRLYYAYHGGKNFFPASFLHSSLYFFKRKEKNGGNKANENWVWCGIRPTKCGHDLLMAVVCVLYSGNFEDYTLGGIFSMMMTVLLIFVAPIINFRVRTCNYSCVICLSLYLTFLSLFFEAAVAVLFDLKGFFFFFFSPEWRRRKNIVVMRHFYN